MITGAHAIIYSTNPDADRAFLRDVLALPHVDAGHGWLIFGLPPSEVAVHPADDDRAHELYLCATTSRRSCADADARHRVRAGAAPGLGILTRLTLPAAASCDQPRHALPGDHAVTPEPVGTRGRSEQAAARGPVCYADS
jgi:hypothetical protein